MSLTVEKCLQAWTNSLRQMNVKADIVFFGDSLIYYGDFSSVFPRNVVCNLGLRGDTIQGMIDRLDQVRMLKPTQVYLMAGINDVAYINGGSFGEKYDCLVGLLLEIVNREYLFIHSLPPVNDVQFCVSCTNNQIISCNKEIKGIAQKHNIHIIDIFSIYVKDGLMPEDLSVDGIHLKSHAYEMWYKELERINSL